MIAKFKTFRFVLSHVLALGTCLAVIDVAVAAAPAISINVMSWNIRYDNPRDGVNAWKHRKQWVSQIIAREKIDIAGLQEVLKRQLDDLKKRLPEMAVYGVGRNDGKTRGEFAPILYRKSRYELLDQSTFWLSRTPDKVASRDWDAAITRIASWVKLKDRKSKKIFFVVNTHFDHRGREARRNSAALIVKRLGKQFANHPVVLMGDFNTMPGSAPYKLLVNKAAKQGRAFFDARSRTAKKPTGPVSTWNGFRAIVPNRRIDFIFVTRSVEVLRHSTLADQRKGRFPSDHLPVVAGIRLAK